MQDMEIKRLADCVNLLGSFLGMQDVPELTQAALQEKYGFEQADVMALFGGSILAGGDVLAQAMQADAAKKYVLVGGAGHTTQSLRDRMHAEFPDLETKDMPEAWLFDQYLRRRHGLQADFLECASTNCGNNITYLLDLLREKDVPCRSIILTQDASMQRRMDAGLRKFAPAMQIINYAAYAAQVIARDGALAFEDAIHGMWDMDRYISLLMGEIPRLTDDAEGYGPRGKAFIAHVEMPEDVRQAFEELRQVYADSVRTANPAYASEKI